MDTSIHSGPTTERPQLLNYLDDRLNIVQSVLFVMSNSDLSPKVTTALTNQVNIIREMKGFVAELRKSEPPEAKPLKDELRVSRRRFEGAQNLLADMLIAAESTLELDQGPRDALSVVLDVLSQASDPKSIGN